MLLHIRKVSEERKGEACIAWRWKGENLIKKVSRHGEDKTDFCDFHAHNLLDDQNALWCSLHHFTDH